ncbi:NAD-dependent epimerase [Halobacteriovorax sp. GB3]|uniref:NAD-dependent epimerase n=1 Tax=Halobacteriovorax sp. GB3 TaxID=2719615 RepID=UPI00235ECFD5|nr:NAD-dependent epimerase [Halobacteriovorax sp. GB3]MDD0852531.1 NAD-dependent epimerase [Halobacteriovorax sp. GB3]
MKLLITGVAGFIGYHTAKKALELGHEVVGIDNLNSYYQVSLKEDRLKQLGISHKSSQSTIHEKLSFYKIDIANDLAMDQLFNKEKFDAVIHLAAQAGVRYSIESPRTYINSNAEGFLNVLEGCRTTQVKHLIYASSSSVYGNNNNTPFKTTDPVDHPVSLYAATKRANELMAHTYSHLYKLPTTGLRFFTVYGPWGRPDMAPFLFTEAILQGKPIKVFNNGDMERDFTFVDDIVEAQLKLLDHIPQSDPANQNDNPNTSSAPFKIFNIGNSSPVNLMKFIETIEKYTESKAVKNYMPMQPGDVSKTYADVEDLFEMINFRPKVDLEKGINEFVEWFKSYYK